MKPLRWLGDSREIVSGFPLLARQRSGYELFLVRRGDDPDDWKPVAAAGLGVREIRIHVGREYRVLYVAKFAEAVYVLSAFEKKTHRTPQAEIELAAGRFRALVEKRRHR